MLCGQVRQHLAREAWIEGVLVSVGERRREYTSVEICAGAGGQALGLHRAGFAHRALIEIDEHACRTLEHNTAKQGWQDCRILRKDLLEYTAADLEADLRADPGVEIRGGRLDLLSGGVPCPPFSVAGKQLGKDDERDLFPAMLDMAEYLQPKAVMIENVRGLLEPAHKFADYREWIIGRLEEAGYTICGWDILEACDYGVPQLRPRAILVAMQEPYARYFTRPRQRAGGRVTVAEALKESMRERFGEEGRAVFEKWLRKAEENGGVAPTLVGGSKKHGGADLGPTRAKRAWAELGIDAHGVADEPHSIKDPERDLYGERGPKLTVTQAAIIQGFPADWEFQGRKTAAYRQVGNAFPPPVAQAVGESIISAIAAAEAGAEPPEERTTSLLPAGSKPRQLVLTG